MKIKFRLERLEVGRVKENSRSALQALIMGQEPVVADEDENNSPELVRAEFVKVDGKDFEGLTLLLDLEVAKLYMIGEEYEMEL